MLFVELNLAHLYPIKKNIQSGLLIVLLNWNSAKFYKKKFPVLLIRKINVWELYNSYTNSQNYNIIRFSYFQQLRAGKDVIFRRPSNVYFYSCVPTFFTLHAHMQGKPCSLKDWRVKLVKLKLCFQSVRVEDSLLQDSSLVLSRKTMDTKCCVTHLLWMRC